MRGSVNGITTRRYPHGTDLVGRQSHKWMGGGMFIVVHRGVSLKYLRQSVAIFCTGSCVILAVCSSYLDRPIFLVCSYSIRVQVQVVLKNFFEPFDKKETFPSECLFPTAYILSKQG